MKQELDYNYDINARNMTSFTEDQTSEGWVLSEAEFVPFDTDEEIKVTVLSNGVDVGECGAKQIFQMKDGKYILEVEDEEGVEYFYSENIEDLL
jgi:hypothetical protein